MARALASPCPAVPLLVTFFFLWHGGTVILAQTPTETSIASPTAIPLQINCSSLNWTTEEDGITVQRTLTFDYATAAGEDNKTTTPAVNASRSSNISITGLEPGCPYNVSLYSSGSQVCSILLYTRPAPVSKINVTGMTTKSVDVTLIPPNVTCVASYTYIASVSGGVITLYSKTAAVTGLQPGQNYTLTVYSRTPTDARSPQKDFLIQTKPSPVINFIVANKSEASLTLQWTVPNDISRATYSYQVTVSRLGTIQKGANFSNPSDGDVQTGTIGNLSPGVSYELTIYSVTPNGIESNGTTITGANATTKPSPVINFIVANKSDTSLTLQWTVPNDTYRANYSYQVTVSRLGTIQKRANFSNPSDGDVQTGTIGNLSPGVSYELTIYSVTPNGIESNGTTITGANATTKPSPVINFIVSNKSETSLTLQWTVPNDTYRANYSYQVTVSRLGTIQKRANFPNPSAGDVQTGTIGNLSPGVSYELTIYSVTPNGIESNGTTITGANATTMPSPVRSFNLSNSSVDSLTLLWTVPNDTYQSKYKYLVFVDSKPNTTFASNASGGSEQTGTINSLSPGVPYDLSIYSVTNDGVQSIPKTITDATTNPSPVSNVNLKARTNSSITISWQKPDNLLVNNYTYWVNVQTASSTIGSVIVKQNISTQDNLEPGTLYTFIIQSVTVNNVSSTTTNYTSSSNPNPPENLMASPVSDTGMLIEWTAPKDRNAGRYQYNVTLTNSTSAQTIRTDSTNDTKLTFEALNPGNLYTARVNSWINGAYSTESQAPAQTKPQTVRTLSDVVVTNTTAFFSWEVDLQSMSTLSGFLINTTSATNDKNSTTLGPAARSHTITGLTPGMNYTFEFWSFASSTWGPAAPSGTRRRRDTGPVITTYSTPMKQSAQTAPGTSIDVKCTVVSGGYSLDVAWICPSGSFDQIQVLLNNVEKTSTDKCSELVTVRVAGLQPAYEYKVSVRTRAGAKAVNSAVVQCQTDPTGVIVGAIFGVLLFLVLIGIIIFFVLKFRRTKGGSTSGHSVSLNRRFPPDVAVGGFPSYFQRQHSDSDFGFAEEYQLLSPIGTDQQQTAAKQEENRPKNRYTNVLPYDIARVKLRSLPGDPCSDYINASYMHGYNSSKEFIAAQGPLPSTIGDFWRMVWEHRVGTMVMLTNCTEGGKLKCEHYWPLDYTPCTYGDITVTVTSETILPQWTTREFTLKHAKEPGLRYVSHFHYTVWPDHGVPDETATVIRFRNLVRDHMDQRRSNGPAVVHCSAGVGRTGTLIALDSLMQQVQNEKQVGVFSFIKKMRLNRPFMVQTESQYIFLNQCMLDVIQKPHVSTENIYENQMGGDLIYENVGAVKHYGNANGRMA